VLKKDLFFEQLLVFIFFCTVYIYHLYPALTPRDGIEIACYAPRLIALHQPGYPLFLLLSKAFAIVFPLGNQAYQLSLFSAVCSALALTVLYGTVRIYLSHNASIELQGISIFCSFFGIFVVGLSPVFFSQAILAEVFSLNTLIAAIILDRLVRISQPVFCQSKDVVVLFLLMGLGLAHHQTIVFLFPAIAFAVISARKELLLNRKLLIRAVAYFIIGFSVYFSLIPLSGNSFLKATSWIRLLSDFQRSNFGSLSLARPGVFQITQDARVLSYIGWLSEIVIQLFSNLGMIGFICMIVGACYLKIFKNLTGRIIMLIAIFKGPVFLFFILGMDRTPENIATTSRFMHMPCIVLPIMIGCGTWAIVQQFANKHRVAALIAMACVAISTCPHLIGSVLSQNRRNCFVPEDYATNLWYSIRTNSTLLLTQNTEVIAYQYYKMKTTTRETIPVEAVVFDAPVSAGSRNHWIRVVNGLAARSDLLASASLTLSMGIPPGMQISPRGLLVDIKSSSGNGIRENTRLTTNLFILRGVESEVFRSDVFVNGLIGQYYAGELFVAQADMISKKYVEAKRDCHAAVDYAYNQFSKDLARRCLETLEKLDVR